MSISPKIITKIYFKIPKIGSRILNVKLLQIRLTLKVVINPPIE